MWVWLNEALVVDGAVLENYFDREGGLPARGPIQLQTHGGEIRWRNIYVTDLSPPPMCGTPQASRWWGLGALFL